MDQLINKAIEGKIPVYFVLAHGKDYSPTSQTVASVPKNKLLILPVDIGDMLTYEAAEELAKKLSSKVKLSQFLRTIPTKFTILKQTEQFPDTILKFHDDYLWTGIYELPEQKLSFGLKKEFHKPVDVNMKNVTTFTPHKKRLSTFLNDEPDKEAVYIVASCRGVKGVPHEEVFSTYSRVPKRTSAQQKKLETTKKAIMRTSKKRPASTSASTKAKKARVETSKKRKRPDITPQRKKQKTVKSPTSEIASIFEKLKLT